jgi:acyl-CoA thioesterase I
VDRRCLLIVIALVGCSQPEPKPAAPVRPAPAQAVAPVDARPAIVCFGDSLTAGYGLEPGHSYPDRLQEILDQNGHKFRVVNLGVSGDTSSGGLERVPLVLELKPYLVVLELGANDGLRGLPVASTKANLEEMVVAFQKAGARVLLAGITLPRNYGPDYIKDFDSMFSGLARRQKLGYLPFLLQDVATNPQLMQPDGLHPNDAGTRRVAQNVWATLKPMLGP